MTYAGKQALELPAGRLEAHALQFQFDDRTSVPKGPKIHRYWFAADPALRHVMVRYQGPDGQTYALRSVERRAYWK